MDHKIWLSLTRPACLARRLIRTYDPADPPHYFDCCIWPMAVQIEEQVKRDHPNLCKCLTCLSICYKLRLYCSICVVFLSGEQEMDAIFQAVQQFIA